MERQVLPGLKTTFLIHFIVGGITGLLLLLVPDFWGGIVGVSNVEPWFRMLGAAVLAFTASSWWAYHEILWERVKIIVEMELVWTVLGTIVGAWGMFMFAMPTLLWINPLILAAFAIAFGYFYLRETAVTPQPMTR